MTYGHVYKNGRTETFDEELIIMRSKKERYSQQLEDARKVPSVPSAIAMLEGRVDAYATVIHAIETIRIC